MRITSSKRTRPLILQPFVPPSSPDRFTERMMLELSVMSLGGLVALSLYVALQLDLPRALWAFLPMLIMPSGFLWAWHDAKRKRIAAEQQVERYRAGLRRAIADQ